MTHFSFHYICPQYRIYQHRYRYCMFFFLENGAQWIVWEFADWFEMIITGIHIITYTYSMRHIPCYGQGLWNLKVLIDDILLVLMPFLAFSLKRIMYCKTRKNTWKKKKVWYFKITAVALIIFENTHKMNLMRETIYHIEKVAKRTCNYWLTVKNILTISHWIWAYNVETMSVQNSWQICVPTLYF